MEKTPQYSTVNWRDGAKCLDEDPDLFTGEGADAEANERRKRAIAICGKCVVKQWCKEYALDTNTSFGIFGGEDFGNRNTVRRLKTERYKQAS